MWKKVLLVGSILIFLSGCTLQANEQEKQANLEYTIVEEKEIPEKLAEILEEKKKEEFKLTFEEEGTLYLCIGYGEQRTGGYSIAVQDVYLSENAIYFDTSLIGPGKEEMAAQSPSFPYLVIKTEAMDKPVVFQ